MNDSGSNSNKKIVFKRGVLANKGASIDELPDLFEELPQPEQPTQPTINYQEAGEIFDQFYALLSKQGGIERIAQIASEPLVLKVPPPRPSAAERAERAARHRELAEALAHQIYLLAQKQREGDLDLYLSAFNVVLGDKEPAEAKAILDQANEFFTEHYYTVIRDRGERPEISHQIIKRVGHEDADRITCIAKGMDVERVAETVWNLHHGAQSDKESRINDILLDCTERQLIAVRDEFLLIPYKSLAKQAHQIMNSQASETATPTRRSIGKSEVNEQKRQAAFKGRDDIRALRYLFQGRSVEEMALVKRLYLDLSDPDKPDHEASLEAHVEARFNQLERQRLGSVLEGWSPSQEAAELNQILYPPSLRDEIEDTLSDPRDSVDRDHTAGIGLYLRKFRKRRMWRNKSSIRARVLNSYELIAERVALLSRERFLATNRALKEQYGYELEPLMFKSLEPFDARRVALALGERLPVIGDLFEVIPLFYGLGPREGVAVQRAYLVIFGEELVEALSRRLKTIGQSLPPASFNALVDRYINGVGRAPLNQDLLAGYCGRQSSVGVWQPEYTLTDNDERGAITLANLLDSEGVPGELDRPVYEALREFSYDQLNGVERAFYELTDPPMPLREALRSCLSPELFIRVEALLAGFDLNHTVERIHADPNQVKLLADLPVSLISAARELFEQAHFVSLESFVKQSLETLGDQDTLVEYLSLIRVPEVYHCRDEIRKLGRDTQDHVDQIRQMVSEDIVKTLAFERAYDLHFPRLRTHLKLAAARLAISNPVFAELLLRLEGVDPEVLGRLLEYFDAVDIDSLLATLRHYKFDQGIIEETYDLIHPDATLRRAIKEMKVDLDEINETLLHLEGHSALDVAQELGELIGALSGEELGSAVLTILAAPTASHPNARIPEDINWMDEMMYQVYLAHQREYRQDLIEACRSRGVPNPMLEELTVRVFGMEVCGSAREISGLHQAVRTGNPPAEGIEQRICSYVESRGVRFRARLIRAYDAYWARQPGSKSLLDDIENSFRDSIIRRKMNTLLLGAAVDPRTNRKAGALPIQ